MNTSRYHLFTFRLFRDFRDTLYFHASHSSEVSSFSIISDLSGWLVITGVPHLYQSFLARAWMWKWGFCICLFRFTSLLALAQWALTTTIMDFLTLQNGFCLFCQALEIYDNRMVSWNIFCQARLIVWLETPESSKRFRWVTIKQGGPRVRASQQYLFPLQLSQFLWPSIPFIVIFKFVEIWLPINFSGVLEWFC